MLLYVVLALFVAAIGAVLRFAIADRVDGVNLAEVGLIMLVVGAIGFVLAICAELMMRHHRLDRVVSGPAGPVHEEIRQN